jgi:hypothetical protein
MVRKIENLQFKLTNIGSMLKIIMNVAGWSVMNSRVVNSFALHDI